MNSCVYECEVMHHRLKPKEHRFSYRIFLCAFDLDEVDALASHSPVFSRNRPNLFAFRDRDHVTLPGGETGSVRDNLEAYLSRQNAPLPAGARVMLVTLPRILGYVFNPVSFYFCFDAAGVPLCAVAEVNNTFGEQKLYLAGARSEGNLFRRIAPKHFYISPFSELELSLDFRLRVPDERLDLRVNDVEGGGGNDRPVFLSTLIGRRKPLSTARLLWYLVKYPLLTVRIIFLIHWHALVLRLKGIPWHRKAANPHLQREVLRPHASIGTKTP